MNVPIVSRQMDLIIRMINERNIKGDFIEIGCGEGHNLEILSRIGMKGIGIDFSDDAVTIGKQKQLKNIEVKRGDLFNLHEKSTEIVFLLFVLEHIKDDCAALIKINSIIKNGGYLILSLPAHSKAYSYQDKLAGHYKRYDKKEIINKLKKTGFEEKIIWSFGFPISNMYTKMYNVMLSFRKNESEFSTKETKNVGIKSYKKHFPWLLRPVSGIIFAILTMLVKLDALFLNTDLGTHYIILAKKNN